MGVVIRHTLLFLLFVVPFILADESYVDENNGDANGDITFDPGNPGDYENSGYDVDPTHSEDGDVPEDPDEEDTDEDEEETDEDDEYGNGEPSEEDAAPKEKEVRPSYEEDLGDSKLDRGTDDGIGTQNPRNTDFYDDPIVSGPKHVYRWTITHTGPFLSSEEIKALVHQLFETSLPRYLDNERTAVEVLGLEDSQSDGAVLVELKLMTLASDTAFRAAIYYLSQDELAQYGYKSDPSTLMQEQDARHCDTKVGRDEVGEFMEEGLAKTVIFESSPFQCEGWLSSFQFYRTNSDSEAYLGLWTKDYFGNFVLLNKILIPRAYPGVQKVDFPEPWQVQEDQSLGIHYPKRATRSIVGFTTDSRVLGPRESLKKATLIDIHDEDLSFDNPLQVSNDIISSIDAAFSYRGDFSTDNRYPVVCSPSDFVCNDGTCLPFPLKCDNKFDCPDGSDEVQCVCSQYEFDCGDGECIDDRLVCNREYNCRNGRDEGNCEAPAAPAIASCDPTYQFECGQGMCIDKRQVCDGNPDCPGGGISDEDNCFLSVAPSRLVLRVYGGAEFTCSSQKGKAVAWSTKSGQRLPYDFRDEGNGNLVIRDVQATDAGEYVCSIVDDVRGKYSSTVSLTVEQVRPGPIPSPSFSGNCGRNEFQCRNGKCIQMDYMCDGDMDCEDQSDEINCSIRSQCEPNEFLCRSKKCISVLWRCDGDKDCGESDNSDEAGCDVSMTAVGCRKDEFACHEHDQCIPLGYHCDNQTDCRDASDEYGCTPPTVPKPMSRKITGKRGHNLTLTCEAQGVPAPVIVWRLNWGHVGPEPRVVSTSERLTPYSKFHQLATTSSILTIHRLHPEDEGAYSCEAINSLGSTFASPDTIVIVTGGDKVCRPGTFNSAAVDPSECLPCWCSGVTDQCYSADNLYYYMKTYDHKIGFFGGFSPRDFAQIEYIAVSQFRGNKLSLYGGKVEYDFFYNVTATPSLYPGPYIGAYIVSPKGKLYYFFDRIPEMDTLHHFKLPITEKNWYMDERKTIPATRSDFMYAISNLTALELSCRFVDTVDHSGLSNIKISESSRGDQGIKAYKVEECQCPPGYAGYSCESCAEMYQRDPVTGKCVSVCDCNGHSSECTGYGDYFTCVSCQHNTDGPRCEKCAAGFYGNALQGTPYDCMPCDCARNPDGSPGTCWEKNGEVQCDRCPTGSYGVDCRKCHRGYIPDSKFGCIIVRQRNCNTAGTDRINPDQSCYCKAKVEGELCDRCVVGTFGLSDDKPEGCSSCQCFDYGTGCMEANDLYYQTVRLDIDSRPSDFDGLVVEKHTGELESAIVRLLYPQTSASYVMFRDPTSVVQYWILPKKFFENPLYIYNGKLSYGLFYQTTDPNNKNFPSDVILATRDGRRLEYNHPKESHRPNFDNQYEVIIKESEWIDERGQRLSTIEFLKFLQKVVSIKIKAKFTKMDTENRIFDVKLVRVSTVRLTGYEVQGFQKCQCQTGYDGHFCERCSQGYEEDLQGSRRYCRRREITGFCPDGYYFDPSSSECKECKCPHSNIYDGKLITCEWRRNNYVCNNCPTGHDGDQCDRCQPLFVGYPKESYGRCEPIDFEIENPEDLRPGPEHKERTEAELNSDVTLRCHLIGSKPVAIRWYRANDVPLPESSFVNPDDGFSLTIRRIQRADEGVYYCQAKNFQSEIDVKIDLFILVDDRPQLEIIPNPTTPKTGDFFTLRCFTRNVVDNAQYTWSRKDGQPLRGTPYPDGSLIFQKLEGADRGQYLCKLRSDQGGSSATYDLNIADKKIVKADEGSIVQLECSSNLPYGIRENSVTWLKNGVPISASSRIEIYPTTLRIIEAIQSDAGVYTCAIRDGDDVSQSDVTLIIEMKQTKDHPVIVGQRVMLTCVLRPDQNPRSVYWLKDGSTDLGARTRVDTDNSLVIESSTYEDSGTYTCVVETIADREEHQVRYYLIVQSDPRPSIQGVTRQVTREGERLVLLCQVTGEAPVTVKWLKNQREIQDPRIYFDPYSNSLTISSVVRADEGVWTCFAENKHGNFAHHVNVDVVDPNPSTGETRIIDIRPGVEAELWCRLGGGEGIEGQMTWTKNGVSLPSHLRLTDGNSKLIIERAKATDAGLYTCKVFANGALFTQSFELRYTDRRPTIKGGTSENRVPENSAITFPCIVSSAGEYQVNWKKNGRPLYTDETIFIGKDNSLTLRLVTLANTGTYTCTARNQYGSADYTVFLTVEPLETLPANPGAYILEPRTVNVRLGQTAEFRCVPTGDIETLEAKWFNAKGQELRSARHIQTYIGDYGHLVIKDVQREDAGTIVCQLMDIDFEEYKAFAEIVIQDAGPVEQQPTAFIRSPYDVNVKRGESVRVECEVQGSAPLEVYWTHNNRVTSDNIQRGVLSIGQASERDEGEYICYARNPLGTAASRFFLNVQDPELAVELGPLDPLKEFEPFRLSCFAGSQLPVDNIVWTRHDGPLPPEIQQAADANGHSMYIPTCAKEDQGRYICTVYFMNGKKEVLYYTLRLPGYTYYPDINTPVTIDFGTRSQLQNYRITITPYDTSLTKDSSAMLVCQLQGDSNVRVKYEWYHDGRPIDHPLTTADENYLTLRDTKIEQSGLYTCVVNTPVGRIYEQAIVTVKEPDYAEGLLIEPRDVIKVRSGDPLKILCTLPSDPYAYIVWQTPYGETFQQQATATVDVDSVDEKHAGWYTCSADNQFTDKVQVIIDSSGSGGTGHSGLHVYPATTTMAQGQNVDLNCYGVPENTRVEWFKFQGDDPRTSEQWYPISEPNIYARDAVLSVVGAQHQNAGLYKCVAYTRDGLKEAVGKLEIIDAPVLTISPSVAKVTPGARLELRCDSGLPNTVYEWKREYGTPISPFARSEYGVLTIESVRDTDAGKYTCAATNEVGYSEIVVDVILTSQPAMVITPENPTVQIGGELELACITGTSQSDGIVWQKRGGQLPERHQAYSYFLKLFSMREEDRGFYECSFSNQEGLHTVQTFVDVREGHESKSIQVESARVGDEIKIACQVYASPDNREAVITWLKDDQPLPAHHQVIDSVLTISNAQETDKGVYKCSLSNYQTGSTEAAEVRLEILVPPVIPVAYAQRKLAVGSRTTLSCLAYGNPPPTIMWSKNGVLLPSQDGVLTIDIRDAYDFGKYLCTASNKYGEVESIFELEQGEMVPYFVQDPPSYLSLTSLGKINSFKSIEVSFRSVSNDGLIMFLGDNAQETWPYLSLGLTNGRLDLRFGTGEINLNVEGPSIKLDQWYTAKISLDDYFSDSYKLMMQIEEEKAEIEWAGRGLQIKGYIFFGGLPNLEKFVQKTKQRGGFTGCVSYVSLNDEKVDIGSEIYEVVKIRECPVCEKRPCQNGGTCSPANAPQGFRCKCLEGFSGANCDQSNGNTNWGNFALNGYNYPLYPGYPGLNEYHPVQPYYPPLNPYYQPDYPPYQPPFVDEEPGEKCLYSCHNGGECYFSFYGEVKCQCPLGFSGDLCENYERLDKSVKFNQDGYLELARDTIFDSKEINQIIFEFKVNISTIELLFFWQSGYPTPQGDQDLFAVSTNQYGYLTFHLRSQKHEEIVETEHRLLLGREHSVSFEISSSEIKVTMDGRLFRKRFRKALKSLDLFSNLFIGGVDKIEETTQGRFSSRHMFNGCISYLRSPTKSSEFLNLYSLAYTGVNAKSCK